MPPDPRFDRGRCVVTYDRAWTDWTVLEGDTIRAGFETREKAERYGRLVHHAHPDQHVRIARVEHTERVSSVRDLPEVTA